jgi:TRAP-type C4-dicarboxylate transport system permease small subunit
MKKFFDEFEIYIGAFCQGLMVLILLAQVVSRYIFNNAFSWSEETAIILFILSVYFGATAAIRRNQHLKLEIVLDKLSPKNRLKLEIFNNSMFALFNVIILFGIVPIVLRLRTNGTETAVTGIPKWYIYIVLPVLFVLMIIRLIQDSGTKFKKIKNFDSNADSFEQNN